jgi:hypothetical protein
LFYFSTISNQSELHKVLLKKIDWVSFWFAVLDFLFWLTLILCGLLLLLPYLLLVVTGFLVRVPSIHWYQWCEAAPDTDFCCVSYAGWFNPVIVAGMGWIWVFAYLLFYMCVYLTCLTCYWLLLWLIWVTVLLLVPVLELVFTWNLDYLAKLPFFFLIYVVVVVWFLLAWWLLVVLSDLAGFTGKNTSSCSPLSAENY